MLGDYRVSTPLLKDFPQSWATFQHLICLPAASLDLTTYLLLSPLHCPPPKCVCADGPIFPHPQTGDVIRGNLICLECSGDGRKLFCSNICKCIHHGVPGNPSPQADDFVIFMKVWLKVLSNDQPNFPSCYFSCAPRQKEGMRMEASPVLSILSFPWVQAQTWSDDTELLPWSEVPQFSGFLHVQQLCKELASIVFIIFESSTLPRVRNNFV